MLQCHTIQFIIQTSSHAIQIKCDNQRNLVVVLLLNAIKDVHVFYRVEVKGKIISAILTFLLNAICFNLVLLLFICAFPIAQNYIKMKRNRKNKAMGKITVV